MEGRKRRREPLALAATSGLLRGGYEGGAGGGEWCGGGPIWEDGDGCE